MRHPGMQAWAMAAVLAAAAAASAQSFPPDNGWTPLRCGNRDLYDPPRDQPGAVAERDIVGDAANPAGFIAADDDFLYLRMRLDVDPTAGGMLSPFSWGFAFDLDDDPGDYEALLVLDGAQGLVALHRNTATTVPDSLADPADQPPLSTAQFTNRGRIVGAGSSPLAGPDAFLDLAVSWQDLTPLGVSATTPVRIWVGTGTAPDRLDDDVACHDGGGGGAPSLSGVAPPRRPLDPDDPGGGNGGGPGPGQTRAIEGGPGCALSPGAAPSGLALLLLFGLLAVARRRRRDT